jgi:hypothetical protein
MSEAHEKVDIILNQTSYTQAEAEQLLALHNNDEVAVIRYYLTGSSEKTDKPDQKQKLTSKNQLVYTEIRKFMDACSKNKIYTLL